MTTLFAPSSSLRVTRIPPLAPGFAPIPLGVLNRCIPLGVLNRCIPTPPLKRAFRLRIVIMTMAPPLLPLQSALDVHHQGLAFQTLLRATHQGCPPLLGQRCPSPSVKSAGYQAWKHLWSFITWRCTQNPRVKWSCSPSSLPCLLIPPSDHRHIPIHSGQLLSRAEYILYTTRYSTPYLREDLRCELIVEGGEREALIILCA